MSLCLRTNIVWNIATSVFSLRIRSSLMCLLIPKNILFSAFCGACSQYTTNIRLISLFSRAWWIFSSKWSSKKANNFPSFAFLISDITRKTLGILFIEFFDLRVKTPLTNRWKGSDISNKVCMSLLENSLSCQTSKFARQAYSTDVLNSKSLRTSICKT